jgi:putative addiction module CopG family antidote
LVNEDTEEGRDLFPMEEEAVRLTEEIAAPRLDDMDVRLSPDQEAFVRQAIESGRFREPEDAVREALSLWEERERKRIEILAALGEAEESVARGEVIEITTESMRSLAGRVKKTGRERLESERNLKR